MRQMDPKAAANEIRHQVVDRPSPPPIVQHTHNFVMEVCRELGIEVTPPNFIVVVQALKDAGIQPHQVVEYPKMLTEDGKPVLDEYGHYIVFKSRADEDRYRAGKSDPEQHHDHPSPGSPGHQEGVEVHQPDPAKPTVEDVTKTNPFVPPPPPSVEEKAVIEPHPTEKASSLPPSPQVSKPS